MSIIEVGYNDKNWKLFHQVPFRVYKKNPYWIAPIESDVNSVFNPKQNKAFEDGAAKCFVFLDNQNKPVGRIAAFIDHKRNRMKNEALGGIGYFECVEDISIANLLFEKAAQFLQQFDVDYIDGPINFGERDKFWGLLTNCFDKPPLYQENYHPSYYYGYFKKMGFEPYEQILTMKGNVADIDFDRIKAVADRIKSRSPMKAEKFNFKKLDKYAEDFSIAYNGAFGHFDHFKPITPYQVKKIMQQAKLIADPSLVSVVYYEDQPVGFAALFPEINPLLKKVNGKLNWRTIPGFLLRKFFCRQFDIKGMGFGVVGDFQNRGVYTLLIDKMGAEMDRQLYKHLYLATIRAHNKEAVSVYKKLNTVPERIHYTMRKPMKEGLIVKRLEFID